MGRAYGNIGNAYSAAGFYEQAIKYHKQELTISKEVHDRSSEASTHGNLAVAYQALGAHDMALFHYRAHLGKLKLILIKISFKFCIKKIYFPSVKERCIYKQLYLNNILTQF